MSATITGRDGHRYRVIYSGRPADGAGPDFRDAILLRDDGLRLHGHVEVHVRSADWHKHGHGSDNAYNGVVLHVVAEDSGPRVDTPSGLRIPLLVLKREFVESAAKQPRSVGSPLTRPARTASVPLPLLNMAEAGDEWFRNRTHGYRLQIAESGADQAMWEGALECLGYPSNKKPFRQLASKLNWCVVSEFLDTDPLADPVALFEYAAGFEPKSSGMPGSGRNTRHQKPLKWNLRSGRPANSPRLRVLAAAAWAVRWQEAGSLAGSFIRAVRKAETARDLATLFIVPSRRTGNALLGRSRAGDIVVNHLLPAVHALATEGRDIALAGHAKYLFDSHPLLSTNSITREASRLLETRGVNGRAATAREQQGLIHIYRMTVASQQPERQLPLV